MSSAVRPPRRDTVAVPLGAIRAALVLLVLAVVVLAGVLLVRQNLIRLPSLFGGGLTSQIDRNAYQAVFLTGGQVFFGRVGEATDGYLTLSDVFYLSPGSETQPSQLVKRGRELHGPSEPMIIPTDQVLFIENLRNDSDVVTAIGKFHAGTLPVATPPQGSLAPATTPTAPPRATATPSPSASR